MGFVHSGMGGVQERTGLRLNLKAVVCVMSVCLVVCLLFRVCNLWVCWWEVTCPAKGWGGHDIAHHKDSHHGHECHTSAQGQSLGGIVRPGWQNVLQHQTLVFSLPGALFWRYATGKNGILLSSALLQPTACGAASI